MKQVAHGVDEDRFGLAASGAVRRVFRARGGGRSPARTGWPFTPRNRSAKRFGVAVLAAGADFRAARARGSRSRPSTRFLSSSHILSLPVLLEDAVHDVQCGGLLGSKIEVVDHRVVLRLHRHRFGYMLKPGLRDQPLAEPLRELLVRYLLVVRPEERLYFTIPCFFPGLIPDEPGESGRPCSAMTSRPVCAARSG